MLSFFNFQVSPGCLNTFFLFALSCGDFQYSTHASMYTGKSCYAHRYAFKPHSQRPVKRCIKTNSELIVTFLSFD